MKKNSCVDEIKYVQRKNANDWEVRRKNDIKIQNS